MATKTLGKYEIVPSVEQLMAIVEYFEKYADEEGNIVFTQSEMIANPIISPHFKSSSFLNGVNTYLSNEDMVQKIHAGTGRTKSKWNVSRLLKEWDKVLTREVLGKGRPQRRKGKRSNVEVEVVHTPEAPVAPTPAPSNNAQVLAELDKTMKEMIGFIEKLPAEMTSELNNISSKLELTDADALRKLQADNESLRAEIEHKKKDFESEVQRLKTELEEVSSKKQYNTHSIYRQRNAILDDVDRLVSAPAWQMKNNSLNFRHRVEEKLDLIMEEIGIKATTQLEEPKQ